MTYGMDTSVILRIITSEPYPLAEKVQTRVAEIIAAGGEFIISELPASEAYYSLQHFYGRTKEEAIMALRALADEDVQCKSHVSSLLNVRLRTVA